MQSPQNSESTLVQALRKCIPNIQNAVIQGNNLLKIKTLDGIILEATLEGLYKIINIVESNLDISIECVEIDDLQIEKAQVTRLIAGN